MAIKALRNVSIATGGWAGAVAMQELKRNIASGTSIRSAFTKLIQDLPITKAAAVVQSLGPKFGLDVDTHTSDGFTSVRAALQGEELFNVNLRQRNRWIETAGIAALAFGFGVALGQTAWTLGRSALSSFIKLNVPQALAQGLGAYAISSIAPSFISKAFGAKYADMAARFMGYGMFANVAYNAIDLLLIEDQGSTLGNVAKSIGRGLGLKQAKAPPIEVLLRPRN